MCFNLFEQEEMQQMIWRMWHWKTRLWSQK